MRQKVKPDARPKWSDESLPCIRQYKMGDGSSKVEVEADYERRYREMLMQSSAHPDWRSDPTYELRRKK